MDDILTFFVRFKDIYYLHADMQGAVTPVGAIWRSVSCPITLRHEDKLRWKSNLLPSNYYMSTLIASTIQTHVYILYKDAHFCEFFCLFFYCVTSFSM